MIVEQRIGRIQRLASEYASVGIFNIMLRGTFEEYIVGRLMEKLQMASHAIGDIESLLEASGINDDDENGASSFDERIRQLVVAALAGKDVEVATRKAEESIVEAKKTLEQEEASINAMLGGMEGVGYIGPRAPNLPRPSHSMEPTTFTIAAFDSLGAHITPKAHDLYLVEEDGSREYIRFVENAPEGTKSALYAPGTNAFIRLVGRVIATGVYDVDDLDGNPAKDSEEIARDWVVSFNGRSKGIEIEDVNRYFDGTAIIRVRATVAYDSYERLVSINCEPRDHNEQIGSIGLGPLPHTIENPKTIGINLSHLSEAAKLDAAISEFSRFYLERRAEEMKAAGTDERKKKKLEDEFSPRLEMTIVALEGKVYRQVKVKAKYAIEAENEYETILDVRPHTRELIDAPVLAVCAKSGKTVPKTCLKKCEISGSLVLKHLLSQSEISSRFALPEFIVICALSGKRILKDEAEVSEVSGRLVARSLLKTSALSGKRAEPEFFGRCDFTKTEVLNTELATSEVSGKYYRVDEQVRSDVSGKIGHKQEFIQCYVTRQSMTIAEAEQCAVTGQYVRPGILESCEVTQKRVLPSELERCAVTGKRVLKGLLVSSSLTSSRILESIAIRSSAGKYCAPMEARICIWSGQKYHPEDIRICALTGLPIHFQFTTTSGNPRLQPLVDLLNGIARSADEQQLWDTVTTRVAEILGKGRCRVEAAVLSPSKRYLAVCSEVRTLLGLKARHIGIVYSIKDNSVAGRVTHGRRTTEGWLEEKR